MQVCYCQYYLLVIVLNPFKTLIQSLYTICIILHLRKLPFQRLERVLKVRVIWHYHCVIK
jgi:hypothetical protein